MANDGIQFTLKIDDNTIQLLKEKDQAVERALYAMGTIAVEGTVRTMSEWKPQDIVDTGRLRASISFITPKGGMGNVPENVPQASNGAVKESKAGDKLSGTSEKETVVVGTNVEYAEHVHNGTSRMTGRPFLKVGIENKLEEMEKKVNAIFKGEL